MSIIKKVNKNVIYNILTFIFLALALSWLTFINGFPLYFTDSAIYILSSLRHIVITLSELNNLPLSIDTYVASILEEMGNLQYILPQTHPIFYSYFILPFHLTLSLLPVVIAQALIFLYVLYLFLKTNFQLFKRKDLIIITLLLAVFSSLPWNINIILADFFAPIIVLLFFLLGFCQDKLTKFEIFFCFVMLVLAISFHYSYLPLAGALAVIVFVLNFWIQKGNEKKSRIYMLLTRKSFLLFCPILLVAAMHISLNLIYYKKFTISIAGHEFLMARFIGDGTIKKYLKENCDNNKYQLCSYQESLTSSSNYLHGKNSPRYKIGVEEEKEIIRKSIIEYPLLYLENVYKNTLKQLITFNVSNKQSHEKNYISSVIKTVFPNSYPAYKNSLQHQNKLNPIISFFRKLHNTSIFISLILSFIWFCFAVRYKNKLMLALFTIILAGLIINAGVTGSISGIYARYQNRIVWLVQFYALIGSFVFVYNGWYQKLPIKKAIFFLTKK